MRKVASMTGLALVSTLMISVFAVASSAPPPKPPAALIANTGGGVFEADIRAIGDVRQQWLRAINRGELAAVLSAYAPGAVLSAESQPPRLGVAEIDAFLRRWDGEAEVVYDVQPGLLSVAGNLAVEEWTAYVTVTPRADALGIDGDVFQYRQSGVHVYRKDVDGRWHIDRETWSADPAAVIGYADSAAHPCWWRVC